MELFPIFMVDNCPLVLYVLKLAYQQDPQCIAATKCHYRFSEH